MHGPRCRTRCVGSAEGVAADPIGFGSHRRPEAVVIPFELYVQLVPVLEDLEIAQLLRERAAAGESVPLADVAGRRMATGSACAPTSAFEPGRPSRTPPPHFPAADGVNLFAGTAGVEQCDDVVLVAGQNDIVVCHQQWPVIIGDGHQLRRGSVRPSRRAASSRSLGERPSSLPRTKGRPRQFVAQAVARRCTQPARDAQAGRGAATGTACSNASGAGPLSVSRSLRVNWDVSGIVLPYERDGGFGRPGRRSQGLARCPGASCRVDGRHLPVWSGPAIDPGWPDRATSRGVGCARRDRRDADR